MATIIWLYGDEKKAITITMMMIMVLMMIIIIIMMHTNIAVLCSNVDLRFINAP